MCVRARVCVSGRGGEGGRRLASHALPTVPPTAHCCVYSIAHLKIRAASLQGAVVAAVSNGLAVVLVIVLMQVPTTHPYLSFLQEIIQLPSIATGHRRVRGRC